MHYKQLLLGIAMCLGSAAHLYAQDQQRHFYIKAGVEYAAPVLTTKGFEGNTDFSINPPSGGGQIIITGTTAKKTSFGNGLWASLHVGYFFVENIGLDIGVQMGIQQPDKEYTYTLGSNQITNRINNKTSHPLLFNPSITYRLPIKNHLVFMGKAGVVLPFSTKIVQKEYRIPNTYLTSEITNRFALGFSCGLGVEYKIARHLSLSADANMVALSVDSKKKVMTSFTVDGKELISEVPDNIKITNYEYEVKYTGLSTNITEPISTPFSRLGIKLGVTYYF